MAILLLYLCALATRRDTVPAGLNNDAAEETLRGLFLIDSGRFEVITSVFGIPQETLYLYVAGASAKLLGTTTLAVQATSWLVALACLGLLPRLARRLAPEMPAWIAWMVAVSSVWLFHYARAGVRAVSAPFFFLAVCLLLDRAEAEPARRSTSIAAGAALGLALYAYTSCRVLVIAFVLHAAVHLIRGAPARAGLLRRYGLVLASALVVSIPNLAFMLDAPHEFLWRGGYVLRGGFAGSLRNLLWSALLTLHYPDAYRTLVGSAHIFDGVSAGLTTSGVRPVHPLVGVALIAGLVAVWRRRERPAVSFTIWTLLAGTLALGISGPSLTRFLVLLPAYLAIAAAGFAAAARRLPAGKAVVGAVLLLVLASSARDYFVVFPASAEAQRYFSPAATPIGKRARELAHQGARIACVVAKDANVVNYLTYERAGRVTVNEFYRRPLDPAEISLERLRPNVLLVERHPAFGRFIASLPESSSPADAPYAEVWIRAPEPISGSRSRSRAASRGSVGQFRTWRASAVFWKELPLRSKTLSMQSPSELTS